MVVDFSTTKKNQKNLHTLLDKLITWVFYIVPTLAFYDTQKEYTPQIP